MTEDTCVPGLHCANHASVGVSKKHLIVSRPEHTIRASFVTPILMAALYEAMLQNAVTLHEHRLTLPASELFPIDSILLALQAMHSGIMPSVVTSKYQRASVPATDFATISA
jgi:hypothetical protein